MNLILKLKISLKETLFTIPKKFNLNKRCHLKRHFPQFHKFQYILKVSLEETPSTIPKNWIYTERPPSIEATLWKVSQYKPNFFKNVEGVKRHLSQFPKNGIILKVFLEETPSIILKKLGLY